MRRMNLGMCILRMFEDTYSLGAVHLTLSGILTIEKCSIVSIALFFVDMHFRFLLKNYAVPNNRGASYKQTKTRSCFPFSPEFLTWTLSSLNFDTFTVANRGFNRKSVIEWQTVLDLMRRCITSRLLCICTVCKCICVCL